MDENALVRKIEEQNAKIEQMYASVEKLRKYFLWTLIITLVLFIVPLIALAIMIPSVMSTYTQALNF